jgi:hypothetical protein
MRNPAEWPRFAPIAPKEHRIFWLSGRGKGLETNIVPAFISQVASGEKSQKQPPLLVPRSR